MTDEIEAIPFVVHHRGHNCTLTPTAIHEYNNCRFEAGTVEGHPDDTFYFRVCREDEAIESVILLRPDEMLSLIWVLSGSMATNDNLGWQVQGE
jgi:hypothetical protein